MTDGKAPAILCISTYEKGQRFLQEAARLGAEVSLLTVEELAHADWPKDILTNFFTMPTGLTPGQVLNTVLYLARTHRIDRIVALDEFDLEVAALLREHMRLPGLGETHTRFFRDKLAMRTQARRMGVLVPDFTGIFNHDDVSAFLASTQGPWLLKPRTSASAIGIRTISSPEDLWPILDELGDLQSHHLLECFVPGEVFHAEGVTWNGALIFEAPCKYGKPPMQTMHQGGVFTTRTLPLDSADAYAISRVHHDLIRALEFKAGVTHTEFIKSHADGRIYFLETAARVGGAYIADVIEFARGVNPWVEWARIEFALATGKPYVLPVLKPLYAGSVICLARQQEPDLTPFVNPEIVLRLHKDHHAGILLESSSEERLRTLVDSYADRFLNDFCASMPVPDKPTA
jgi:hypothetical protein